jgi:hypothetical protein
MAEFLRKELTGGEGACPSPDGLFELDVSALPALLEHLSVAQWEDGSERETSTLLVFTEDGTWKACLNDRSHDRTAWAAGRSLVGLLLGLEAAVAAGTVEWRRPARKKK